ncbi:MAG: CFI-box-CTERM domain-containing protein, partial [Polyangiales bacterium]
TTYSVGIRAYDNCSNTSPLTVIAATTLPRTVGEVDACFIATAAYGSLLANDVEMLRRFRDLALKHSVLGELAVETYYTFGPAAAGVIGESELLRWTAREVLAPMVTRVKTWTF